ncbi:MAG TPA: universal stress protein [Anaerolineae bacterium]|nr:universal stress protein [Anaerolineae bacterium]
MKQTVQSQGEGYSLIGIGRAARDPKHMRYAEAVSKAMGLRPVLFHVSSPDEPPEEGERLLATARAMLTTEDVEVLHVEGDVEDEIIGELKRRPYQLLVMETSISDPDQSASQLSQRLANRAKVSVLLVRNPPERIAEILICTGGHPASTPAVSLGINLAQAIRANATILYVASSTPSMYTGLPALEEGLEQVLTRESPLSNHLKEAASIAEAAGVETKLELRHGVVAEEIIRACDVKPNDLVVIGAPKPGALIDRLLLGRVAPQLISSNKCSTLIVRNNGT